jgi:hypothetical protein
MVLACSIIPSLSTDLPLAPAADALALVGVFGLARIFTRQLDMLMTTEQSVEWVADNFVAGNYKLVAQPTDA